MVCLYKLLSFGHFRFILEALPSIKWTGEIKEKCFRDIVQRFTNILQRISSRSEQMVSFRLPNNIYSSGVTSFEFSNCLQKSEACSL